MQITGYKKGRNIINNIKPTTIAYFKAGIGNLIQATSAFQALASMDHSKKIDICLDSNWTDDPRIPAIIDLINNMPFINQIICFPKDKKTLSEYKKFYIPTNSSGSDAFKEFIKLGGKDIYPQTNWRESLLHESICNMKKIFEMGYEGGIFPIFSPHLDLNFPELSTHQLNIGVCNGAFNAIMWDKKKWPFFKELIPVIKNFFDAQIISVGSSFDSIDPEDVDIFYNGKLSILESAGVIKQLDYFITTDTGLMHIADALKKRGVVLFGPTLISKNAPINGTIDVLTSQNCKCAPCQELEAFYTCQNQTCMQEIKIDQVMFKIREGLND